MRSLEKLTLPQPVRPAQVHDPDLVRAAFGLAYLISSRMDVRASEWSDYTYFLADFVEVLGVDAEALERIANLDTLTAPDDLDEEQTTRFYDRLYEWHKRKLCRRHAAQHAYVSPKTRPWFLTTMTVLKAAFPEIVRHRPIWKSPRFHQNWTIVHVAWQFEKARLANRITADE